jgi:hypothetical protein
VIQDPSFKLISIRSPILSTASPHFRGAKLEFLNIATGVGTGRDQAFVAFDPAPLIALGQDLANEALSNNFIEKHYGLKNTGGWNFCMRRKNFTWVEPELKQIRKYFYRPFDVRYILYDPIIRRDQRQNMLNLYNRNLAILICQQQSVRGFQHVLCAGEIVDESAISNRTRERCYVILTYLYIDKSIHQKSFINDVEKKSNIKPSFIENIKSKLGVKWVQIGPGDLANSLGPESVIGYIYGILHSPSYRKRYAEFLKIDFPHLPLTSSLDLFRALARFGGDLFALHLVEAPVQQALSARYDQPAKAWSYDVAPGQRLPVALTFTGPAAPIVEKVGWSDDTVWLDAVKPRQAMAGAAGTAEPVTGSIGFHGVSEEVWNFHIGGYQVCQKWLKDRKGRTLSADDLTHYHRIVIALHETIRLMKEIDEVIDQHGGWPGAFADGDPHHS